MLMNEPNTIKNWSAQEQPREKLMEKGASALTDAELLAILIGSGTLQRSAVEVSKDVLQLANNDLRELGRLSLEQMQEVKGIGDAKAIIISAAMELGRSRQLSAARDIPTVANSKQAAEIIMPHLQDLTYEAFYVLYLNTASKLVKEEQVSSGGLTATVADIRMILKNCLLCNASQIIVAHNHPSGNKRPSEADKKLTYKFKDAAEVMDIKFVDHIIIAGAEYLSMADEGLV